MAGRRWQHREERQSLPQHQVMAMVQSMWRAAALLLVIAFEARCMVRGRLKNPEHLAQ